MSGRQTSPTLAPSPPASLKTTQAPAPSRSPTPVPALSLAHTPAPTPAIPPAGGPALSPPRPALGPAAADFHKTIVDDLSDGVYYVDLERRITYWNRGAERLTGYSAEDVVGCLCYANILNHVDDAGRQLCWSVCPLAATIRDGEPRDVEVWMRHRDVNRQPVRVRTAPIRDAARVVVGAVEIFDDASRMISARAAEGAAGRDALTDGLTGVPNRRHLDAVLSGRLEDLARYGWGFGLLLVGIDHFKRVSDGHGHATGDQALRVVSATLAGGVRAGDLVGRWGGEEFAVLVQAADEGTLRETADRLRQLVARSTVRAEPEGSVIPVRISGGGSPARVGDTAEGLLARADRSLYRAKAGGRDRGVIDSDREAHEGPSPT